MKNNSNPLDSTRDLGYAITESIEYKNLIKAEEDFYNEPKLKDLIDELESTRSLYNSSPNSGEHEVTMYLNKIKELEQIVDQNSVMINLTEARSEYDKLFKNINSLISYITDEESRINIKSSSTKSGCGGCSKSGSSGGCCK